MSSNCHICGSPMTEDESLHQDCGGDCLTCMAEIGDIDCPGDEYYVPALEYHHTPVDRVVVTLIKKHESGVIHANSLIRSGVDFHYDFDRFQLTPWQLFSYVVDALGGSKDTGDSNAK